LAIRTGICQQCADTRRITVNSITVGVHHQIAGRDDQLADVGPTQRAILIAQIIDQTAGTLTRPFTIQHTGNGVLTLGANAVSITGSGDFLMTAQPPTSIAARWAGTFSLTFNPSGLGARTGHLLPHK